MFSQMNNFQSFLSYIGLKVLLLLGTLGSVNTETSTLEKPIYYKLRNFTECDQAAPYCGMAGNTNAD